MSLVGMVSAVEWSEGFLMLQRAPQRKPQDASSTRVVHGWAAPKVVLHAGDKNRNGLAPAVGR